MTNSIIPAFHTGSNEGVTNGSINVFDAAKIAAVAAVGTTVAVGTFAYKNGLKDMNRVAMLAQEQGIAIDDTLASNMRTLGVKPRVIGVL